MARIQDRSLSQNDGDCQPGPSMALGYLLRNALSGGQVREIVYTYLQQIRQVAIK